MSPRSLFRPVALIAAVTAAVGVVVTLAPPRRAGAPFQAVADRIGAAAWAVGLTLQLATRYPVRALTVTRDAYCATHRDA